MIKRNFLKIATLAAVGILAAPPSIANTDGLVSNKLSVTLGVGGSNFRINNTDLFANSVDTTSTSYKLATEYRVLNNLGVELAYDNFGKTKVNFGLFSQDIKNDAVSLNLVGRLPVMENVDLFAKAGYARTEARFFGTNSKNNSWVVGLGGEYKFTKQVSVVAEFAQFNDFADSGKKLDNVTAGVKYRF